MCPIDPSPHGEEILHELPEGKFPAQEVERESESAEPQREVSGARDDIDESVIVQRPALPDHPQHMAADVEDEEADPVVDSGPGIADGVHGLRRQRG